MKIETKFEIGDKVYVVYDLDGETALKLFQKAYGDLKQFVQEYFISEYVIDNIKIFNENDKPSILYSDQYDEFIGYDGEENIFLTENEAIKYAVKTLETTFNNWAKQFKNIK
jgi:hypothetical protein